MTAMKTCPGFLILLSALLFSTAPLRAQLPGAGFPVAAITDDFEASGWSFNLATNLSSNGLWYGSARGAPEVMSRVAAPAGAPAGSSGALSVRTHFVEQISSTSAYQEDLVSQLYTSVSGLGRNLTRAERPSYTARVKLPPISTWAEGYTVFGFRTAARDPNHTGTSNGEYYPSIWFARWGTTAHVVARVGDGIAADQYVASFNQSHLDSVNGWMSLGINWDADGRAHYFAHFGTAAFIAASEVGKTNETLVNSPRRMSEMAYHFISVGHPNTNQGSETVTPDFIVDDFTVSTVRPIGAAILADKDGDGLSNGLEYAFGLDPSTPTPVSSIPAISLAGEPLTTSYTFPAGVTGVTYGAESSENLSTWSDVPNTGAGNTNTFRVGDAAQVRVFLRHKITFAP